MPGADNTMVTDKKHVLVDLSFLPIEEDMGAERDGGTLRRRAPGRPGLSVAMYVYD